MKMNNLGIIDTLLERPVVLTGHYGSGKTEITVNLAMQAAQFAKNVTVVDLDIANPYFRSREAEKSLNKRGVRLISNAYGYDITADLPALSAAAKAFLSNRQYRCIVDVGGNDSGARILAQYRKELLESEAYFYMVVNIYRPETDTADKIVDMIQSIEHETGKRTDGLINNTNLLMETESRDVMQGLEVLKQVSSRTGIPIVANCAADQFAEELNSCCGEVISLSLNMRPRWLDM
jgi:MinD-like ATPase involved in chromosome partitioning or flagellar assembly